MHLLMTGDIDLCLGAGMSSWQQVSRVFGSFSDCIVADIFLMLSFHSSLCILDMGPLSDVRFANTFS